VEAEEADEVEERVTHHRGGEKFQPSLRELKTKKLSGPGIPWRKMRATTCCHRKAGKSARAEDPIAGLFSVAPSGLKLDRFQPFG
jgi:hypothetical protein